MNRLRQTLAFSKYLLKYGINLCRYPFMSNDAIFADIYRKKIWNHCGSVSGDGSTVASTKILLDQLQELLEKYNIGSILDIPCGDFSWMNMLDFKNIEYTGADIVQDIIDDNKEKYGDKNDSDKQFIQLDICSDKLPQSDIIFCRDCLVHLSDKNIFKALGNIKKSGSKYILMTTFPGRERNYNMITGAWRPINFQKKPFYLPEPMEIINEGFSLRRGRFTDKSMGLWEIKKIEL